MGYKRLDMFERTIDVSGSTIRGESQWVVTLKEIVLDYSSSTHLLKRMG